MKSIEKWSLQIMNSKSLLKTFAVGLLIGSSVLSARADVSTVTLDIDYSTETNGRLTGSVTFDAACGKKTVTKLRCVVSYESEDGQVAEKLVLSKNLKGSRTSFNFNEKGLNAIEDSDSNNDAILSCQAQVKCKNNTVESNVDGAFVNCGKGVKEVTPKAFLTALKQKLTPS